jgi:regulator of PEP synthase PpsR (kinase-PPPase family)
MNHVFVVSDGSGGTAEQVLKAALMQFEGAAVEVKRWPEVRTEEQIRQVVQEAKQVAAFVVHTLVSDDLRDAMLRESRLYHVEAIDLMGPLLARLSHQLSISPAEKPGLFRQLNEEYFRRIETMEFAFHHDDGRRAHELDKAEIVLVGVSRTFKTPLSIYLAFLGWFVANVPVVMGIDLPPGLFDLKHSCVIGLTIDPARLAALRRVRAQRLGGATGNYADPVTVRQEVAYALHLFQAQRWPVIEVTGKPIEETATEILSLVKSFRCVDQTA